MKLKIIKGVSIEDLIENVNNIAGNLVQFSNILHEDRYYKIVVGVPETIVEKTVVKEVAKEIKNLAPIKNINKNININVNKKKGKK